MYSIFHCTQVKEKNFEFDSVGSPFLYFTSLTQLPASSHSSKDAISLSSCLRVQHFYSRTGTLKKRIRSTDNPYGKEKWHTCYGPCVVVQGSKAGIACLLATFIQGWRSVFLRFADQKCI